MNPSKSFKFFLVGTAMTVAFSSCKKDNDDPKVEPGTGTKNYEVPTTYNFQNVNYSGQTTRIKMLKEIAAEMNKGRDADLDVDVDGQKLKNMFSNTGSPFAEAELNTSGKQLESVTFSFDRELYKSFFDSIANASKSEVTGSKGVSGIVVGLTANTSGVKPQYLVNGNGFEYAQVVLKGLMGAAFYHQATSNYLTAEKIGNTVNNTDVKAGDGTPMEHHWDEAFGYFGAPKDFPANKTGLEYWANYSNQVDPAIGTNAKLMNAFLKGRAAISNKDMTTKDEQAKIIKEEWEKLVAGSAVHEFNAAKKNFGDVALRLHYLSEAYGFVLALKYNVDRKINDAQITKILGMFGTNLYDLNQDQVNSLINEISAIYNFESVKSIL